MTYRSNGTFETEPVLTSSTIGLVQSRFMTQTYGWMFLGLLITAGVSLGVTSSESALQMIAENRGIFYGVLIAEFILVLGLTAASQRISAATATLGFLLYSALNGITFSLIFMLYTATSIGQVFFVAAGMFGGMAVFGSVTKRSLSGLGTFMAMGLWGIILVSLVNIFIRSESLSLGTSAIAILVFSGLTAYDAQKIKSLAAQYSQGPGNDQAERKGAIFGALTLYLDFVNLFLSLLRIFGNRRN